MSTEIVKSPMLMLQEQLDKGVSVEQLKGLMDLAERWQKIEAEKAWNQGMMNSQRDMQPLVKSSHNKHKDIWYAGFEQLDKQIRPIYLREGFSLCFTEIEQDNKEVCRMAVDVMHVDGHSRRFVKDVHIDGVGIKGNANMTPTQADGSTTSYARRYVTKMAFNLVESSDLDLDGETDAGNLTADEVKVLQDLIDEMNMLRSIPFPVDKMVHWLREGCTRLDEIPRSQFTNALQHLNQKRVEIEQAALKKGSKK